MARANAFMSGLTGGMTAINSAMDSADQRAMRRQQMDDQAVQRNALSMMHIYNSFGDDVEKRNQFDVGMFNTINDLPAVKEAMGAEYPGGNAEISGFEPTAQGIVPMVSYTNAEGQKVTEPIRSDGKPVAVSQDEFFTAIGSQPELVSEANLLGAKLLGSGASLPESPESFELMERDGVLLQKGSKSGFKSLGQTRSGSRAGGSGGSLAGEKPFMSWSREADDGKYDTHIHKYGDDYVMTEVGPDGGFKRRFVTEDWIEKHKNQAGGSVEERMGVGGDNHQPGVGVLAPEHLEQGMVPGGGNKESKKGKPDKDKKTADKKDSRNELPPLSPDVLARIEKNRERLRPAVDKAKEAKAAREKNLKKGMETAAYWQKEFGKKMPKYHSRGSD